MEFTKIEVSRIEEVSEKACDQHVRQLDELQLALVGGGTGEVVFA